MDVEQLDKAIFRAIRPFSLTLCYYSCSSLRTLDKEWAKIKKQVRKLKPKKGSKIVLFLIVDDIPYDWQRRTKWVSDEIWGFEEMPKKLKRVKRVKSVSDERRNRG